MTTSRITRAALPPHARTSRAAAMKHKLLRPPSTSLNPP